MPWSLDYHEETRIVELHVSGRVTGVELREAAIARIAMGREKVVDNYIINASCIDAPKSATQAVYDIPTKLYNEEQLPRTSTIAVVAPADRESMWITSFYEDICVNRGWRVETFLDRDKAVEWLLESRI